VARGASLRTIRGISYSVRSGKLHVNIPLEARGSQFVTAVSGLGSLTKRQIQELRYRFSTDRGRTFHEARGRLVYDEQLGAIIDFGDLETSTLVGSLEGCFITTNLRTPIFGDYVFAIPD